METNFAGKLRETNEITQIPALQLVFWGAFHIIQAPLISLLL